LLFAITIIAALPAPASAGLGFAGEDSQGRLNEHTRVGTSTPGLASTNARDGIRHFVRRKSPTSLRGTLARLLRCTEP